MNTPRIHSAAGLELRNACKALYDKDKPIEPGYAGMTKGYHLAAPYVIHAVGPSVRGRVRDIDLNALRKTYRKAMSLARKAGLRSIAFPCLSAGERGFPRKEACGIAVDVVLEEITAWKDAPIVCFVTEKDEDRALYEERLGI